MNRRAPDMYVASNRATGTDMEKYQSRGMPRKASPLLAGSAAPVLFTASTPFRLRICRCSAASGSSFSMAPCVPVGNRHDLLAERAGLYLPCGHTESLPLLFSPFGARSSVRGRALHADAGGSRT